MRRHTVPGYLLAFVGGIVLLAACSGGSSREEVPLDTYLRRVQTLHEEQEQRSEVLSQDLAAQFEEV